MRGGGLEQVGTPDELYGAPINLFVGGFIGRSTTAEVTLVGLSERGARIAVDGVKWEIDAIPGRPFPPPGRAIMLVRPEALRLTLNEPGAVPATITARRFIGPTALFTARTDGGAVLDVVAPPRAVPAGARVGLMVSVALAMIAYAIDVEALGVTAALGAFFAPVLLGQNRNNADLLLLYLASMFVCLRRLPTHWVAEFL